MEKFFRLKENNTDVKTEIIAGITTFITMAYILFVNPQILSLTGMDQGAVFTATAIAAAIGTLVMGFVANVPYAQAPGMGLNAFFTFTVCMGMQMPWEQALAIVFICGLINILITVTKVRKMIIEAIPATLQYAISAGIGLFIAYIGFISAHFLDFTPDSEAGVTGAFSKVVPAIANFTDKNSLLALIGLVIIVVLMILKVKGSILIGIIATTLIGIPMGITQIPNSWVEIKSISPTLFKLDIAGLFANSGNLFKIFAVIFAFSLTDTFDTIGTFLGTGRKTGIFDEKDEEALHKGKGFSSKLDKALFADATATSIGALLGTSNTTTYVESAAGIAVGGKTGLTSLVTGVLFILAIVFSPIALMAPAAATAPALIVVGILMMESVAKIAWEDFEESAAAFFTIVGMPFAYSISTGVAVGFIFYVITKLAKGKAKEVHPIMYIVTLLFILNFIFSAI